MTAAEARDRLAALLSVGATVKVEPGGTPGYYSTAIITVRCLASEADALATRLEKAAVDAAKVERVEALHLPYGIYDECGHDAERREALDHFEIDDVGLTCPDGLMYWACVSCCSAEFYGQTELCADTHKHSKDMADRCPTIQALDGEATP